MASINKTSGPLNKQKNQSSGGLGFYTSCLFSFFVYKKQGPPCPGSSNPKNTTSESTNNVEKKQETEFQTKFLQWDVEVCLYDEQPNAISR